MPLLYALHPRYTVTVASEEERHADGRLEVVRGLFAADDIDVKHVITKVDDAAQKRPITGIGSHRRN